MRRLEDIKDLANKLQYIKIKSQVVFSSLPTLQTQQQTLTKIETLEKQIEELEKDNQENKNTNKEILEKYLK